MAEQNDAAARFEARWKQAREQPEVVEAPPVNIDIDLSPAGVLARLRDVDRDLVDRGGEELRQILDELREQFQ